MKATLDVILPSILPDSVTFETIKHEGKTDLERSIPRKLRAIRIPHSYFIILRDQDASDCIHLKARLTRLCEDSGRSDSLIRIVCHELESWFLGDLAAVEAAYGRSGLASKQDKAKYRNPDALGNPSQELRKLIPEYQKLSGARRIAKHLDITRNRSDSFNAFLRGIKRYL